MKMRNATDVFSEWALGGKDEGMEKTHAAAKKIKESGGEVLKFSEMIERFPTGNGVKIIG